MNALIDLSVIRKHDQCIPERFYFSSPFKMVEMNEYDEDRLHLMLMNSCPGVLDGDYYKFEVEIGNNASLQLHTQAYQRVFTMSGSAQQESVFKIGASASFTYLPHPTVPHKGSNFKSTTSIHMHSSSSLTYGELITCGRKHSGECFEYTRFHSLLKIYSDRKLIFQDNLLFEPSSMKLESIGQLEGFTHTATYIHISQHPSMDIVIDNLFAWLAVQEEIEFGISRFHERGIIIRMLANKSELLYNYMLKISDRLKAQDLKTKETVYAG